MADDQTLTQFTVVDELDFPAPRGAGHTCKRTGKWKRGSAKRCGCRTEK